MLKLVWNARDFCMSYLAGPGLRCFGRLWCLYSEYLISSQSLYAWVANLIVFVAVYSVVENFDQLRYDNKYYGFLTFIARHFNSHCMQWFIIQASCLRGKAHFLLLKLYIAIPCLLVHRHALPVHGAFHCTLPCAFPCVSPMFLEQILLLFPLRLRFLLVAMLCLLIAHFIVFFLAPFFVLSPYFFLSLLCSGDIASSFSKLLVAMLYSWHTDWHRIIRYAISDTGKKMAVHIITSTAFGWEWRI